MEDLSYLSNTTTTNNNNNNNDTEAFSFLGRTSSHQQHDEFLRSLDDCADAPAAASAPSLMEHDDMLISSPSNAQYNEDHKRFDDEYCPSSLSSSFQTDIDVAQDSLLPPLFTDSSDERSNNCHEFTAPFRADDDVHVEEICMNDCEDISSMEIQEAETAEEKHTYTDDDVQSHQTPATQQDDEDYIQSADQQEESPIPEQIIRAVVVKTENIVSVADDSSACRPPTDNSSPKKPSSKKSSKSRSRSQKSGSTDKARRISITSVAQSEDDQTASSDETGCTDDMNCDKSLPVDEESQRRYFKTRAWKLVLNNKDKNDHEIGDKVTVEIKTRSDRASPVMPERLYSSLKYEIRQTVSLDLRISPSTDVMMSKMEIVDPKDPSAELLKANGDRLIRGVQEFTAVTFNKDKRVLEVKNKVQFTGVSFHHERKYFAIKLSYFDPSHSMTKPVLVMISSPFLVFARRPTMRGESGEEEKTTTPPTTTTTAPSCKNINKKIKEEQDDTTPAAKRQLTRAANRITGNKRKSASITQDVAESTVAPIPSPVSLDKADSVIQKAKKQKVAAAEIDEAVESVQGNSFTGYMNCLDLLIAFKNNMRPEEQKLALDIAQAKLFTSLSDCSLSSSSAQEVFEDQSALFFTNS